MVDTVVSTERIIVTGGPSTVNLSLDAGPQGQRGSFIFSGQGKPTDTGITFIKPPQIFDWYLNLKQIDPDYLYMYQYVNRDGVILWEKMFKFASNQYNVTLEMVFTDGVATGDIILSNDMLALLIDGDYTVNTQVSIENDPTASPLPVAISFARGDKTLKSGNYVFPIKVTAAEFDAATSEWASLSGTKPVHISINVI